MAEELKPCPFCGSTRVVVSAEMPRAYYVECQDCWASLSWSYSSEDKAIASWNRRAPDEEKTKLLKRYCEVIEEYVSIYDNFPEDLQDIATKARELLDREESEEDE